MGASFYRLRCEVFQNLFLSPMNTGFVRPAVATVPTACGIETIVSTLYSHERIRRLQQYLPLAVLKLYRETFAIIGFMFVATVPTACGIETTLIEIDDMYQRRSCNSIYCLRY